MNRKRIKAAVLLLLFLIAGVLYSTDRNQDFFVEESGQETESMVARESALFETGTGLSSETETQEALMLRVHVCGAVKHAGVYRLKAHSIVEDAVSMAGGFDKEGARDYLNLAAELADGDKIYIPYKKELEESGAFPGSGSGSAGGLGNAQSSGKGQEASQELVNINTAEESLLMTLSGIGRARAQSIINWRNEHGAFARIEDIMQVSGIKDAAFAKIKDYICV